ncbi:putative uncharacterized protein FLJ44672 [Pan paniscus]|uniref:putative uncharacterized protein FLJ44672 n=1 Tax=Pan paniscus TaxID=9597 RepID=UPI0024371327|nr:putative uncharacterized protein FLJ44672 [Pan paniscus]
MGLIPHNGLSRPSFSLPAAFPGQEPPQVGLSRPTCSLLASSPGPALPPGCVSRPDCCLPTTSLDSAPAHLLAALVGPELPQAQLPRPRSGLTVASPGSAPALRRRLQTRNGLWSVGSSTPSLGLPVTSAGPSRPEVGVSRPCLPASIQRLSSGSIYQGLIGYHLPGACQGPVLKTFGMRKVLESHVCRINPSLHNLQEFFLSLKMFFDL